jgi:TFIIF-interacting CTD phosphatase-like protein
MIRIKRNPTNPLGKPLLILDIDETLVYVDSPMYFKDNLRHTPIDFALNFGKEQYVGSIRPYLTEFLKYFNQYFDLAIWSKGSYFYVMNIYQEIIPHSIKLKFVYSKDDLVKDKKDVDSIVKKFKYGKENIFILDDVKEYWDNYDKNNFWLIKPYLGYKNDDQLKQLIENFETGKI